MTALHGRDDDVRRLLDVLEAASGRSRIAFIEGEAGIGKTRLLDELVAFAVRSGFRILRGGATELEHNRPFGPLVEAFGCRASSKDPTAAHVGRLLASPPAGGASELRFVVSDVLVELVERLAADGPVVLALEDLHWADSSTAIALGAIRRHSADLPLAIVGTLRPVPRSPDLARLLDAAHSGGGALVRLGALRPDAVSAIVGELAGATPGPRLLELASRAAGNPFYVVQLVESLAAEGLVEVSGDRAELGADVASLPPTLRDTIVRRVATLPIATIEVLRLGAVLGSAFTIRELAALAQTNVTDLAGPLRGALDAGMLIDRDGRLGFQHDLIRRAIEEDLPEGIRRSLHADAALALAEAGAALTTVAEHVVLGAEPGDADAAAWVRRAAAETAATAPAAGAELLERALGLLPPDDADRTDVEAELVEALVAAGRAADAERVALEVLERGSTSADRVRHALAQALLLAGRPYESLDEIEAMLREGGLTDEHRARALADASIVLLFHLDHERARDLAQQAVTTGERAGSDVGPCLGLSTLAWVALARGLHDEAVELATRAVAVAETNEARRQHPGLFRGMVLLGADRFAEADRSFRLARAAGESLGTVWDVPIHHCGLAMRHFFAGDWDEALAEARSAISSADEYGTRLMLVWPRAIEALVAVARGEVDEAARSLDTAEREIGLAPAPAFGADAVMWARALEAEARGDEERALAVLVSMWQIIESLRVPTQFRSAADLVRLAVPRGDVELARWVTGLVEEWAERTGLVAAKGAALRCRGLVEGSGDVLLEAVDVYRSGPRPVDFAHACEDAGRAVARGGRSGEAARLLELAHAVFDRLGAVRDAARVEGALRVIGARTRVVSRRPVAGWESLTDTERKVVGLVAGGLSNADVAARLNVSRRTVESHLSRVYVKLGMSSRTSLAAEAARRGWGPG